MLSPNPYPGKLIVCGKELMEAENPPRLTCYINGCKPMENRFISVNGIPPSL